MPGARCRPSPRSSDAPSAGTEELEEKGGEAAFQQALRKRLRALLVLVTPPRVHRAAPGCLQGGGRRLTHPHAAPAGPTGSHRGSSHAEGRFGDGTPPLAPPGSHRRVWIPAGTQGMRLGHTGAGCARGVFVGAELEAPGDTPLLEGVTFSCKLWGPARGPPAKNHPRRRRAQALTCSGVTPALRSSLVTASAPRPAPRTPLPATHPPREGRKNGTGLPRKLSRHSPLCQEKAKLRPSPRINPSEPISPALNKPSLHAGTFLG